LANFCFGGNSNPSDKDTIILQQAFAVTPEGAEPGALTVIPCSVSSDAYSNNYQPTPYEEGTAEYERVISKLDGSYKGRNLPVR
jgi:poly-gamma-glutamate synthesis protein (capsule biosynthesis protein)